MTNISLNSITGNTLPQTLVDNQDFMSACFPVRTVQLGYNLHGSFKDVDRIGVLRMDREEMLYVGSSNYKLVKNEDIVLALEPLYQAGYEQVKVRSIHGKRFMFELQTEVFDDLTINGFPCRSRIRICNSYDGSTALTLQFGVYIKICGNGLCVDPDVFVGNVDLRYKHGSSTPSNITNWIHNSTIAAMPFVRNAISSYIFPDGPCDANLQRIAKMIPTPSKGKIHPVIETLISATKSSMGEYESNENFALFMALTNMATYPDRYAIAPSYVELLEEAATSLFI